MIKNSKPRGIGNGFRDRTEQSREAVMRWISESGNTVRGSRSEAVCEFSLEIVEKEAKGNGNGKGGCRMRRTRSGIVGALTSD